MWSCTSIAPYVLVSCCVFKYRGKFIHRDWRPPAEIGDAINMSVAISTLQRVMSADNRILIPRHGTIRDFNDGFKTL